MNRDKLTNIRDSLINGNQTDVREGIKEYGIKLFPFDYLSYLHEIFGDDKANDPIVLEQLESALIQIKYII